jgi:hypothetical protein
MVALSGDEPRSLVVTPSDGTNPELIRSQLLRGGAGVDGWTARDRDGLSMLHGKTRPPLEAWSLARAGWCVEGSGGTLGGVQRGVQPGATGSDGHGRGSPDSMRDMAEE